MFLKRLKFNLNILYVNCMDSWPQHYTSLTELHNSYNAVLWVFLFLKLIGFSLTQRPSNDKMLICTIWLGSNSDYLFFFFKVRLRWQQQAISDVLYPQQHFPVLPGRQEKMRYLICLASSRSTTVSLHSCSGQILIRLP